VATNDEIVAHLDEKMPKDRVQMVLVEYGCFDVEDPLDVQHLAAHFRVSDFVAVFRLGQLWATGDITAEQVGIKKEGSGWWRHPD
jgi:hypothetical protein